MLHPSEVAVDYIYEKFRSTYYNLETISLTKQIIKIKNAVNHRPFNYKANSHQVFIEKTKELIEQVGVQYAHLDFEKELNKLQGTK